MSARTITSLTNPTVKAVRALHMRKTREETGQFLAEGLKIILEAQDCGQTPRILMFSPDAQTNPLAHRAIRAALDGGGEAIEVSQDILQKISRKDNPQAMVAVFDQTYVELDQLDLRSAATFVALQEVRDPGNLGTIIRTADAAGCGGVILIGDCCDPYSVEATRATMGSIFAVPLCRTSPETFLAWRRQWTGSVIGTLLTATTDHRTLQVSRPALLLMGNEQRGLPPDLAAACDVNVKIPMRGRADSLNLAIATGIMIYALLN